MKTIFIRIIIPTNVGELLQLAGRIYARHQADGSNSPLHAITDDNWNEYGPKIKEAMAKHNEAEEYARRAEQAYRERDAIIKGLDNLVKRSRDLLKAIFKKTPKKLGEWGFEVNDTPRLTRSKK
ncbi:MAG TPA: hypothetical protein PKD70_09980 [Saprospiraceae bacterium]|nr:hypothetical protein [Saprospiraceae bacterium]HMP14197.1 hypothetical protein [Saprospiraceae bacterium]